MTSTINLVKQRKLSDLRVIDLQRELRAFNILYDKKDLKGTLIEKLRQALISRNLDPDDYLFDTPADLKSISSDDNNRSHEENGSHETNNLETSTMETDSEQGLNPENPVQTTSPKTISPTTNELDDEQSNRMDTIDLSQIVEERDNDNIFLTIDQSTTKQDDENTNDKIEHGLTQVSCSSSDEELDTNNTNLFHHNTKPITEHHGEDTTTDLSTDNDTISKSEINRQESSEEQQKKENGNKSNKDQCHLWVSNIAKETHASDLKALFSKYGKVLTTKVIGSSSSQWFGYINLATPDDVEKCINALHQTELHGKKIHVDREMHDQPTRSSSSKSKAHSSSTSNTPRKRSDYKTSSNNLHQNRDSITDIQEKSSRIDTNPSSRKRSSSTTNQNKKKLSTSDVNKSNNEEKNDKSHEIDSSIKISNNEQRRNSSGSNTSQSSKHLTSRTDIVKTNEKIESSHKSISNNRKTDKHPSRSEKSSIHPTNSSKSKTSPSVPYRSHSSEKRSIPPSNKPDHHRSSSIDKTKQHTSSHIITNKYEKPKDIHRSAPSNTFENDRRSVYQNEQRLRHEKELLVRKQYVQQQEEEKIKEQHRRLAEERERMRREFEMLERDRLDIERTRVALEKEKQDQARELERQQRRLADEAKHRQQVEAKLRDEKLHRISHNDNKRPRSSHHEPQRSHHSNTNNSSNNSSSSSNKGYDHRSSTNTNSGRGRDRSLGDTNRDYYQEPKRQYTNNANNQREPIFRDRVVYRDSDLPTSSSGLGLSSSSSMASNNNNQRYLPLQSNQHRLSEPYNTLPQRGRDMALPPTSSVSTAYERSSRNAGSPPPNTNAILRRPHSREQFNDREYMSQPQRRDRSPPPSNTLRREPIETTHWERPKPRETAHYADDTHKYLPTQYLSESSQSAQQQQGLWSAAPPSRQQQQQQHHHADLSVKPTSHAPVVDPYGWPHVPQQVPPQPLPSHHPQGLSSSHDRSHPNVTNNQRIPILPSNHPPPPPPPPSRGSTTGQTHLYSHPGVPVSALATSQQHASLAPPPPSLHHPAAYVTQQAPPPGLVLHPTGQTRAYEPHYVVTQPLQQRRY